MNVNHTVEENDLDVQQVHCCGDEDLYPFGCNRQRSFMFTTMAPENWTRK